MGFAADRWYHACPAQELPAILGRGLKPRRLLAPEQGHHPAELVDPDVVYLWPSLAPALTYALQHDEPAIVEASGLDPVQLAPNDERLWAFVSDPCDDWQPGALQDPRAEALFGAETRAALAVRWPADRPRWLDASDYLSALPQPLKARMARFAADVLGDSVTYRGVIGPARLRRVRAAEIEALLVEELPKARAERALDEEKLFVYSARHAPHLLDALPDGGAALRADWSWALAY